jgi:transposase
MARRQRFTKEFKLEAVRLLKQSGRPGVEIARERGIRRNRLYKWAGQLERQADNAFPGSGRQSGASAEMTRLRRENERLREERDILKKAAAYFARESK